MKRLIKKLLREGLQSDSEVIQQYVDIIDNMDLLNPRRSKYIQTLKDKYEYEYTKPDDEYFISNPNLNDIKNIEDFISFNNYKKYSKEVFKLRGIPLQQSVEGTLSINDIYSLTKPFDIQVKQIKSGGDNHAQASPDVIEIPDSTSVETVLHELGHVFDYRYQNINIISNKHTHTITTYGLGVGGEAFAENFAYFFLYPNFLRKYLPEVYNELDSNIPNKWKVLANKLIKTSIH